MIKIATLSDFRVAIRLRLGELTEGTIGTEDYEGRNEVDEIKFEANAAQVSVCRDIWTQQWMPFRRLQETLPVVSNQTIYTLPKDFIQMVSIYHKKPNQTPIELKPKILSRYREIDDGDSGQVSGLSESYFHYYEVSGQIGEIITQGTVTWQDDNYQFAADTTNLTGVRVGDVVNNVTDGSQGVITQFGSGIATLGERLYGGRSNRMQYGDEFFIQTREDARFALETWPAVTLTSPKLKTDETRTSPTRIVFTPETDSTIESVNIQLPQELFVEGGVLADINPQTRLLLYIREVDSTTYAIGETVDILGFQNVIAGINELAVIDSDLFSGQGSIQLNRSTTYDAYLTTEDAALGLQLENNPDNVLGSVTFLQPNTDFLVMNFVKRPKPFLIDESVCELPEELHELIIEKAVLSLMRKMDPKMINASILAHYKVLVKDAKEFLASLLPPEAFDIDDEQRGLHTYSPAYTSYYW